MKVVHVISGLRSGGAEHLVLALCRQAQIHGDVEMSVLTLSGANDIAGKFRQSGIQLLKASGDEEARSIKALSGFGLVLKTDAEIIHAHMFHACLVACMVKFFRPSVKVVFTLHNNHVPQWHRRILLYFTKWLRNADVTFPGLERRSFQKQRTATIATGVDVAAFTALHGHKPPVFTFAFIGRLNNEKNPLALIEIAKQLHARHHFLIRVAGDGPLRSELEARIREHQLEHSIILHGMVDDVPQLLSECHCLLITSRWEGMPLSLLEAGAAGIPVIATPVGSISDIINETNGFVRELHQFVETMEAVMDNYGDALVKARNLMHKVQDEFSIEKCYREHYMLYRQL